MTRQGLAARTESGPVEVARAAVGLQAQNLGAALLGVRARSSAVTESGLLDVLDAGHELVRSWLMRSTVHLVAASDVRWMTALFGPMIERRFGSGRWPELGITPSVIEAAIPRVREVLAGRRLTRHELTDSLAERGVRLADDGQAATHLLLALSARGVTCRGPEVGRESSFALLDDWVSDAADPAEPMAELARRYFRAFGPATAADFTTWSGLPSRAAIRAIRDELAEVEFDGRRGYRLGTVEPRPGLRLLPMFDNYLIGYRDRSALLEPRLHSQVYVGGIIKATVVSDGRIVGTWTLTKNAKSWTVDITPFGKLSAAQRRELERERADLERYFGRPLRLLVHG